MGEIIDGKGQADKLLESLKARIEGKNSKPCVAIVLVGEDPASQVYVNNKEKACNKIGVECKRHNLSAETSESDLIGLVESLNNDNGVHGILVQVPLPKHINEELIVDCINPFKDVDGFHPANMGALIIGREMLSPATPKGVIDLIKSTNVDIKGKHAVIIGRSNNVGKPAGILLLQEHATVTFTHSKTTDLADITKQADILVAAAGKPKLVNKDMIKEGAIVIDVGIHRVDGKLVGDVDFESCKDKAAYITPVPGGVGPMTVAKMIENVINAQELQEAQQNSTN